MLNEMVIGLPYCMSLFMSRYLLTNRSMTTLKNTNKVSQYCTIRWILFLHAAKITYNRLVIFLPLWKNVTRLDLGILHAYINWLSSQTSHYAWEKSVVDFFYSAGKQFSNMWGRSSITLTWCNSGHFFLYVVKQILIHMKVMTEICSFLL